MEIQTALVNEILQVDNPPDFNKEDLDQGIMINNGVRWIQFGLALFYHREKEEEFVQRIGKDILDDLDELTDSSSIDEKVHQLLLLLLPFVFVLQPQLL